MRADMRPPDPFDELARKAEETAVTEQAPTPIKARLYTALIAHQSQDQPLRSLTETAAEGRSLCVFEQMVQIAPVGETAKSVFYCRACHARILAEHFEAPPIFWPHCPYVDFKKR